MFFVIGNDSIAVSPQFCRLIDIGPYLLHNSITQTILDMSALLLPQFPHPPVRILCSTPRAPQMHSRYIHVGVPTRQEIAVTLQLSQGWVRAGVPHRSPRTDHHSQPSSPTHPLLFKVLIIGGGLCKNSIAIHLYERRLL